MAKISIDDEDLKRIVREVIDEKFYSSHINKYTPGYSGRVRDYYGGRIIDYSKVTVHKDKHCMIPDTMASEEYFMNPPYDELVKENKRLKTQNEAYDIQYIDTKKACDKWMQMYSDEAMRCNDIDVEFEEMTRGDLMNLELVKKYLDKVRPTAKTKDEYLKAMNIINKDISNLNKFVEERWGHDEEE